MGGHMLLYRGSLKSCNYRCSYCPFSKHPMSGKELAKDKEQWLSFLTDFAKCREAMNIRALMIVPYGEALIHPWYWEGLARVSSLSGIDAVGAQTNLSFSLQDFFACFEKMGGVPEKLRFWATFHPEMTTALEFAKKCREIRKASAEVCAGAVGVPENIELLRQLRKELPKEIYLWINKMYGLRRRYTPEEEKAFSDIDPYFFRELIPVPADCSKCEGRLFVEGGGAVRTCNISREMEVSWKEWEKTSFPAPLCEKKRCSCFLAYGGRKDFLNKMLFGEYPLFRIPRRPQAVFLDVEGTLLSVSRGCKHDNFPADILAGLEALYREKTRLFFATTLPYREAMKHCHKIRHLFQGGIFAGGAHLVLEASSDEKGEAREYFHFLDRSWPERLGTFKQKYGFKVLTYKENGRLYKMTLFRSSHRPWSEPEAKALFAGMPVMEKNNVRYFIEGNCLQIVSGKADKARGVKTLCDWLSISPKEAFAAGDSGEDEEMIRLCR